MSERQSLLEDYQGRDYPKVSRSGLSYSQTSGFCHQEIARYVTLYKGLDQHDQTARLIRDMIDMLLRRYHGYCIQENLGAHYREQDLVPDIKTDFEHVIPAKVARDCVLTDRMSVSDALNIPTCKLSKVKHQKLKQLGLAYKTPDIFWFWRRYQDLDIQVETRDGTKINMNDWNLDDHYRNFA